MDAMRNGGIEFRMITGGCFPHHAAVKFFDYDIVGNLNHAKLAHERGFFVGNHPRDITAELDHPPRGTEWGLTPFLRFS